MLQRILILNWRDIKNPSSGGAEVLTHEMAKRWIEKGYKVTQFSSFFKGAKKEEIVDGVRIIRQGNPDARYLFSSVHFKAFLFYAKHKSEFDAIVDEVHGLPFFTPLYTRKKTIALICEVAGKIWDTNFPFPFNKIGKFVEKNYFGLYKNVQFLTISPSTKKDLVDFGVRPSNITILTMGISIPKNLPNLKKEKRPTVIFVGRLLKAKGAEDVILSCQMIKEYIPDIKLWIVGRGDRGYEKYLKKLVHKMKLSKNIDFVGFVRQQEKFSLLQRAHLLLAPSIKEGYGLTIPEAGIVGTPSVVYNVEGLRDIVENNKSGMLANTSPKDMAQVARKVLLDSELYSRLQSGALKFAKGLNWDKTAMQALEVIEK